VTRAADPLAPVSIAPARRAGGTASPAVPAVPVVPARVGSFTEPVVFADGLALAVTSVEQGTVAGQGPGVSSGAPMTKVGLELTNGTAREVRLTGVVVTMTYGQPRRIAAPVYVEGVADFAGTVKPGAKSRAVYAFTVPTSELGEVVMSVDLDGVHALATFQGKVK